MTTDETRPEDTSEDQDTDTAPEAEQDAPVALHPPDDGNPDDLAGDLTDPDADLTGLLETQPDQDGE